MNETRYIKEADYIKIVIKHQSAASGVLYFRSYLWTNNVIFVSEMSVNFLDNMYRWNLWHICIYTYILIHASGYGRVFYLFNFKLYFWDSMHNNMSTH